MPIYEYKCSECGNRFEKIVRSDTVIACETCGSSRVEKQFSSFAIGTARTVQPSCSSGCGGGHAAGKCGTGCGH